ncbi:MAG: ABC transporter permease subunit [Hyphomicrobiales bacterium]
MFVPGRCRAGRREIILNLVVTIVLFAGTQAVARGALDLDPSTWSAPWSGDVVLVFAGLLFLGLGFLVPLHAGMLNLGIHAEFLAGFSVAAMIARSGIVPGAQAGLGLLAGAVSGALVGYLIAWIKQRFAVHEILTGLVLGASLVPLARALAMERVTPPALTIELSALAQPLRWAPGLELPPNLVLAWGILLLALSIALALLFAHFLRASVRGFELRASGANPLAAVATGMDVDAIQRAMMAVGGACAGLTGALQHWSSPAVALERWPFPLGFAGVAVALLGLGSVRGAILAALVLAAWINTPAASVVLAEPVYGAALAALLILPVLWVLPRLLPDAGAPRSIWRTRHRESF